MPDAHIRASGWLLWPKFQRPIALPLLLAALCLALLTCIAPDDAALELTIWTSALVGAGLAVLAFGLRLPVDTSRQARRIYSIAVVAMLACFGVGIHMLGMRQFGGYDMSLVVDFGWRQLQGQRFPADFPNTTPPSFLLGTLWALQVGGVYWQSFVDAFALFSLVAMTWTLLLWRALLGRPWMAMALAASLGAMALLPLSSWWYNPITSAACVIFALSSALVWQRPAYRLAWASWAGAVALLASAKPNAAGVLMLPVMLLLFTSREHRWKAVLAGSTALIALEGLLRSYGMGLADFVAGYRGVAERGVVIGAAFVNAPAFSIAVALGGLTALLLPLLAIVPRTWQPRCNRRLAAIGAVTVISGVLAFVTSGEVKLVDGVIIHAGVLIWGLAVGIAPSLRANAVGGRGLVGRYLATMAVLGICLGAGVALSRQRVNSIGPGTFFEHSVRPEPFANGFFKGLTAGPRLHDTYAEVARLLDGQPRRNIFFGPRMQWAYAAFNQASPTGEPVWFQPGFSFAVARKDSYFDEVLSGRFDTMVFLSGDYSLFPPDVIDRLNQHYQRVPGFKRIDVYQRR